MQSLHQQLGWYTRAQGLLAGLLAVLLIAFAVAVYRPITQRLADLDHQIAANRRQLDANQASAGQLNDVARRVDRLRLRLEHFDQRLPRRADPWLFIGDLTRLGQQASLRKVDVQPSLLNRRESFCEWPILLHFEGDFLNVYSFLRQIEEMPRLARVRKLEITQTDPKLGTVEVQMTINIYSIDG